MCEHGKNPQAMEIVADRYLNGAFNKGAEFRRTEKNKEEMALKIWAELRQPFRFICVFSSGILKRDEPPPENCF